MSSWYYGAPFPVTLFALPTFSDDPKLVVAIMPDILAVDCGSWVEYLFFSIGKMSRFVSFFALTCFVLGQTCLLVKTVIYWFYRVN